MLLTIETFLHAFNFPIMVDALREGNADYDASKFFHHLSSKLLKFLTF